MTENEQLFELIRSFKNIHENADKVVNHKTPTELRKLVELGLGEKNDAEQISFLISQYIEYAVKTGHKQYLNQLFSGFNEIAMVGDVLTTLMNTSMYTYEVAPLATLIEKEVIAKMNSYTGFINGDGIFTAGGSNSNMLAMLCARHKKDPSIKETGLFGKKPQTAFVSDQAHYSFQKASYSLGIGAKNLIAVKSNSLGQMIPEELEKAILESLARDETPFFVGATAGTTELGAFDSILELEKIAHQYELWLHVDGSWGGSIILSQNYSHLFAGLEKADSFAWNAHKLMNSSMVASALLVNDHSILLKTVSAQKTDYIFHDHDYENFDLGKKSLHCGRRNDALKVWLAWKAVGDEQYGKNIDKLMSLAQYAENIILNNPDLELLAAVQTLNINFRFKTQTEEIANELNLAIRNRLLQEGISMVNYCHLNGKLSIRLVLVNQEIEAVDVEQFFASFVRIGKQIQAELNPIKNVK